jgi:ElaB/YqjD/DUF883 family membrane-anchored ribosome-binding protein
MNLEPIKQQLKAELERIQTALTALDELDGAKPAQEYRSVKTNKRHMSEAARKRISMAQKARWAKQRKEAA